MWPDGTSAGMRLDSDVLRQRLMSCLRLTMRRITFDLSIAGDIDDGGGLEVSFWSLCSEDAVGKE